MTTNNKAPSAQEEAKEWLRQWDAGDLVWTIEMGGMGPGYEQCIQITTAEMLRWFIENKSDVSFWEDEEKWGEERDLLDRNILKKEIIKDLGLSGAQYGAALSLASTLYMRGTGALNDVEVKDRRIQASKCFPSSKPL